MAKIWGAKYEYPIVFDCETYDPKLGDLGAGVYNGTAVVLGCAVMDCYTKQSEYIPINDSSVDDRQREANIERLKMWLSNDRDKAAANAAYDVDFLENQLGIPVNGFVHDVQIAEPLLDQYELSYSLDNLAKKYGVITKQTDEIERYAENIRAANPKLKKLTKAQQLLAWMPMDVVARYCLADLPPVWEVLQRQWVELKSQNLVGVYELECDMLRLRMMMRRNGIRCDNSARAKSVATLNQMIDMKLTTLYDKFGWFKPNSSREIAAKMLDVLGAPYGRTQTGQPSVTKDSLAILADNYEDCATLLRARQLIKVRDTFLGEKSERFLCPDGRVHCNFYQLRSDEDGTITGRWSCTNPNLQQIPRNDKELGSLVRAMYIPDEGCWYGHTDYSQIEYRVFMHYATGNTPDDELSAKAENARRMFRENPYMDYHQYVIDTVKELTGLAFDRPTAKRVNFGVLYFMGEASLSNKFRIPLKEAQSVYAALFAALPFIKTTRANAVATAEQIGYILTCIGRRQRIGAKHIAYNKKMTFPDGRVVVGKSLDHDGKPRDATYPLFNYLIQGSAADVMKVSLRNCYAAGVYDVLKLHLLVHDETGTSIPQTKEGIEAYREQKRIMENSVNIAVPIIADADVGYNWGIMEAEGNGTFDWMKQQIA